MPYYPKSFLETNLYTDGREYVLYKNQSTPYKGYYYKTLNNKAFTGKYPGESQIFPDFRLVLSPQNADQPPQESGTPVGTFDNDDKRIYLTPNDSLYNSPERYVVRNIPTKYLPILNKNDKENFSFFRYFCKKNNELIYIEIDKNTHNQIKAKNPRIAWDLYSTTSILWYIQGKSKKEIYKINKSLLIDKEKEVEWPGFHKYFKDNFTQFYLED